MATPERAGISPADKILTIWAIDLARRGVSRRKTTETPPPVTQRVISEEGRQAVFNGLLVNSVAAGIPEEQAAAMYNQWDPEHPVIIHRKKEV